MEWWAWKKQSFVGFEEGGYLSSAAWSAELFETNLIWQFLLKYLIILQTTQWPAVERNLLSFSHWSKIPNFKHTKTSCDHSQKGEVTNFLNLQTSKGKDPAL